MVHLDQKSTRKTLLISIIIRLENFELIVRIGRYNQLIFIKITSIERTNSLLRPYCEINKGKFMRIFREN